MRPMIRTCRLSTFWAILLTLGAVLPLSVSSASAAISEFNPIMPVAGVDPLYNRLPAPPDGPEYFDPGHTYGSFVQIQDANGLDDNAIEGLDETNTLSFSVTGNNSPITRVEVLLGLFHPHLNDLDISLQSPNGVSVPLIRRISTRNARIVTRETGPRTFQYVGGIGQMFANPPGFDGYGGPIEPITLVSQLDEDDLADDQVVPFINDPEILDQRPDSNTYLNTIRPGIYRAQGNLAQFNGLIGNGIWRLKIVDERSNSIETDQTTGSRNRFRQGVTYAQIIIHQQGGYKTWTGRGANNNWDDVKNWDPANGAPNPDQPSSVIFPDAAANAGGRYDTNNNIIVPRNLRIADIILAKGAQNYNIDLNELTFYKRCRIRNEGGSNTITIGAATTQNTGRIKLDVAAGDLTVSGPITGMAGIKKLGPGLAVLSSGAGASSFTGSSVVQEGILRLMTPTALGSVAGSTSIRDVGIVQVGGLAAIAEPFVLIGNGLGLGALHITATQALTGEISLDGGVSGVRVDTGMLTISDFADSTPQGATRFGVNGPGSTTFTGAQSVLPPFTELFVGGATLTITEAQPNLGKLVLNNAIVNGAGTLSPRDLKGFLSVTGAVVNSGTSSIVNPMDFGGAARVVSVTGNLSVSGVVSNGALTKTGNGTLAFESVSNGLPVTVSQGTMAGSGAIGALTVQRDGILNPTNTFDVSQATFASQSAFIVDVAGDQLVSTGTVSLSGNDATGAGGAVLQPYQGATGLIINGPNVGAFEGYPRAGGVGVTYTGTNVTLGAVNGRLVWFVPNSYQVDESTGSVAVTVEWQGGVGTAALRHYGGNALRDYNLVTGMNDDSVAGAGNTRIYTVKIPQNFVDTGDISTTLALVPFNGARIRTTGLVSPQGPFATININEDDGDDQKTCGLGTGLTVFLLVGFALVFRSRLRRP